MSTLTKQGLRASLQSMLEYGYKARERGESLLAAQMEADRLIEPLVTVADNCPNEIMRIPIKHSGKRPDVQWKRGKQ